jgi:hypothetical protein
MLETRRALPYVAHAQGDGTDIFNKEMPSKYFGSSSPTVSNLNLHHWCSYFRLENFQGNLVGISTQLAQRIHVSTHDLSPNYMLLLENARHCYPAVNLLRL